MITIGFHLGGPEQADSLVFSMLRKAMNVAADARDPNFNDGTRAWINPIFVVPGSLVQLDFEGLKPGHFSRKRRGLAVVVAVPHSVAAGDAVAKFVVDALRKASALAEAVFSRKGIPFSPSEAERIIQAIETSFAQQPPNRRSLH
jgi:hypothetical protein